MRVLSAGAAVLLLAGCGAEAASAPAPAGAVVPDRRHADACPLTIDGVRADIETTGRGSTVTLSASPDQLLLLRARAHALADTQGGILGACPCGATAAGPAPASDVSIEDVEGGAKIVVAARDPSDSQALGKIVRTQLALVHGGDCPLP